MAPSKYLNPTYLMRCSVSPQETHAFLSNQKLNVSSASYCLPLLSCCQRSRHKDCQLSHSPSRSQKIVCLFKYTLKPSECTSGTSKNFLPWSCSCLKINYLNKSPQLNAHPARVWDVITSSCNHLKSLRDSLGVSLTWLEGKEEKKNKNTLPLSLWLLIHRFFFFIFYLLTIQVE